MDRQLESNLRMLGMEISKGRQSKPVLILKTLLRVQLDSPEPLTFAEIFRVVNNADTNLHYSKAWVHRLLKELADNKLIRVIANMPGRKKYVCDINTLATGLKKIKMDNIEDLTIQMDEAKTTIESLESLDTENLAQQVFAHFTGKSEIPTSRFLSGIEEFHLVTDETIYGAVKEGDVIRSSVLDISSFLNGANNRIGRILTTPIFGADIRYAVTSEAFQLDAEAAAVIPEDWMLGFIKGVLQMQGKGLDFRIMKPQIRGYQFVSLNDEVMALIISHNPVTAAWIKRKFNSSLIDNVIKSFDRNWETAIPLDQLGPKHFKELEIEPNGYMISLLEKAIQTTEPVERYGE